MDERRFQLAVHAPHAIPDWFQPTCDLPKPPEPERPSATALYELLPKADDEATSPKRQFGQVHNRVLDDQIDAASIVEGLKAMLAPLALKAEILDPIVRAGEVYQDDAVRYQAQRDALRHYQLQLQQHRAGLWPWAWADLVLASDQTGARSNASKDRLTALLEDMRRVQVHGVAPDLPISVVIDGWVQQLEGYGR